MVVKESVKRLLEGENGGKGRKESADIGVL